MKTFYFGIDGGCHSGMSFVPRRDINEIGSFAKQAMQTSNLDGMDQRYLRQKTNRPEKLLRPFSSAAVLVGVILQRSDFWVLKIFVKRPSYQNFCVWGPFSKFFLS